MTAGECGGGGPRPVEDVLSDVEELLDELTASVTASVDGVAVSRLVGVSARLRVTGARLDAVRWMVLPRIEAAGLWAQSGARTFAVWLARTEDVQTVTARREVRTARALRDHLPATLARALAGEISGDKVRALVDVATTSNERIQALGSPAVDLATTEPPPVAAEPVPVPVPVLAEPAAGATDGGAVDGGDGGGGAAAVSAVPTWEEQLLDWSSENGPDRFRGLVRYFARHADPDADERGYRKAKDREYLDVAPTLGGYHVSGFLTEEHGLTLTTAITSVMGAPAAGDDRTAGQRRAQALADLARVVLDNAHTGTGASVRPHVSVTVSWTELQALAAKTGTSTASTGVARAGAGARTGAGGSTTSGTGVAGINGFATPASKALVTTPAVFTETNTPVPASLLRRIACDSQVTRIVFGPDSQILDVGRTQRTVTGQLRKAVIARDKHCVLGQCDQPPSRCEVHHALQHWADGGQTSVTNAALLCWYHHDLVDSQHITMHYDNGWRFTDRNGRPIRSAISRSAR
jgi:hypothetical protein